MDMYQNFVLHGGPDDGALARIREGVLSLRADADPDGRYRRLQFPDVGPFVRNEYHWVPNV